MGKYKSFLYELFSDIFPDSIKDNLKVDDIKSKIINKNLYKQYTIKSNCSKENFVDEFLNYLKEGENVPVDIINSKIKIIDMFYLPCIIFVINGDLRIQADIGVDRKITNDVRRYNKNTSEFEIVSEETVITDWHSENFFMKFNSVTIKFLNKTFCEFIQNKHKKQRILSVICNEDFNYNNSRVVNDLRILSNNISQNDLLSTLNDNIEEDKNSDISAVLLTKGDKYRNVYVNEINRNIFNSYVNVPIGYIEYIYNNKIYYYVKSLNDNSNIYETKPKYEKQYEQFGLIVGAFILHYAFVYGVGSILSKINPTNFNIQIFGTVILILTSLFFLVFVGIVIENYNYNLDLKRQYINKIFEENISKLKNLILNLRKPYYE